MAFVRIDTKYAKRDVERMRKALIYLGEAQTRYTELNSMISDTYKGQAATALSELITTNRMKKTSEMIEGIKLAKNKLETAIQDYERLSKNLEESINGR